MKIELHPKQTLAFRSRANEILYGGAAGGGKSYLLRIRAIVLAMTYPGLQIYLFRRQFSELIKNHLDGPCGFRALLNEYLQEKFCRITSAPPAVRFCNGSVIHLCHCHYERDVSSYQGTEIHVLLIDELTHFSDSTYRALRARCRMPGLSSGVLEDALPLILCGANPGGPGHNWVKAAFIDCTQPFEIRQMPPEEGGMLRQYIPARLQDNPSLNAEEYASRLAGLRSPYLVKAMLEGSWDIVDGGMFDDLWDPAHHVIEPFVPPVSWRIDRSFDWGASHPYSVGFWAESDGSEVSLPGGKILPTLRGDLFRIGEIYGWNGQANSGSGDSPDSVAKRILTFEKEAGYLRKPQPGPADNSIFDSAARSSIASEMEKSGIRWMRSDKSPGSRKRGWVLLRQLLQGAVTRESPGIFIFSNCIHFIRTVPTLGRSPRDPDDVDTEAEDHIADETRYRILETKRRTSTGHAIGL